MRGSKKKKKHWIDISMDLLNMLNEQVNDKANKLDSVKIDLFLTPMFAPQSIMPFSVFDQGKKQLDKFIIQFKYLVTIEENIRVDKLDDNFKFVIGEDSGKIYSIEINIKSFVKNSVEELESLINDALIALAQRDDKIEPQRPKYLSKIFNQHKDDIFSDLSIPREKQGQQVLYH